MKIKKKKSSQSIQFENTVNRFNRLILGELYREQINCWVAGGSVRDYFRSKGIKTDIDLFFPNEDEFKKAKSTLLQDSKILFENENGLKLEIHKIDKKITVDLIKIYFDSPIKTIKEFDFTVSMFAVDNYHVYYGETSFIDLSKKQIMVNKITYPASTLKRLIRYIRKGFYICDNELIKIIESIKNDKTQQDIENNDSDLITGNTSWVFLGID